MAFNPEPSKVPSAIGMITVTLKNKPATAESEEIKLADFEIDVLDADGQRARMVTGNLVPHLTAQQINSLMTFMANLRTQAEAQILP